MDIMFIDSWLVLHIVDEATRFLLLNHFDTSAPKQFWILFYDAGLLSTLGSLIESWWTRALSSRKVSLLFSRSYLACSS